MAGEFIDAQSDDNAKPCASKCWGFECKYELGHDGAHADHYEPVSWDDEDEESDRNRILIREQRKRIAFLEASLRESKAVGAPPRLESEGP